MSLYSEITAEAAKSAPPVAVTGAVVFGMSITDWASALTVVYVLLQIFILVRKMWREKPKSKSKPWFPRLRAWFGKSKQVEGGDDVSPP